MPTSGKRSVRAQLLLQSINAAIQCAINDDYLNAVTNMRAAAASADYSIPPAPYGTPDIVRGDVWKKWRSYYHTHFPTVHQHVNEVLKKLTQPRIGVKGEEEDEGEE